MCFPSTPSLAAKVGESAFYSDWAQTKPKLQPSQKSLDSDLIYLKLVMFSTLNTQPFNTKSLSREIVVKRGYCVHPYLSPRTLSPQDRVFSPEDLCGLSGPLMQKQCILQNKLADQSQEPGTLKSKVGPQEQSLGLQKSQYLQQHHLLIFAYFITKNF